MAVRVDFEYVDVPVCHCELVPAYPHVHAENSSDPRTHYYVPDGTKSLRLSRMYVSEEVFDDAR